MNKKRILNLMMGPLLMIFAIMFFDEYIFSSFESRAAIGVGLWMAYWWVTAPIDYAVTALLPIVLNALLQMTDMSVVIANYASETVLLLLSAFVMVASWEKTRLDQRIAVTLLKSVGNNLRIQFAFWFLFSAIMSSVLPNVVVCATIIPIAISMLTYIGEGDIKNSEIGKRLLLIIVYATGIGGLATPLGGMMNLITVDYLQQVSGEEFMYSTWIVRFFPIVMVLIISNIIFLIRDIDKKKTIGGTKEYFERKFGEFPKMKYEEKVSLFLFVVATVLSFMRGLYKNFLPMLRPAYIFMICAIILFLITDHEGNRLIVWSFVQKKIKWELIYIFAGGLAIGTLITGSGAADDIGTMVMLLDLKGGYFTIFIIITITILLSDITSNTATAAVTMPIIISIMYGLGKNPIPYIYISSVGVNLSYMLPTSIRAIPVGYGLNPKYLFGVGWKLTIIVIVLMTITCSILYKYWPVFSTV